MGYSVFAGAGQWRAAKDDAQAMGFFGLDQTSGAWTAITEGLPSDVEVRDIVVRPDAPETLFAGTQYGPYRSDDGGLSWRALPLPDGTSAEDSVVWSLELDPEDADTIYAGTQGTTVFRSPDGGDSWQRLPVAAPPGAVHMSFPMRVIDVARDPGRAGDIYAGLEVGGVVRSLDGGASWESCNEPLLALSEQDHLKSQIVSDTETEGMMDSHSLTLSPTHPGSVWLANRMGLFRSDDQGASWNEIGIGRFSPLTYARDIMVSRHAPETIYAALSTAAVGDEGSLYRSTDFGETWSRFDHGVSIESTLMIIAESVETPDRVFCAARRGQVFGTEDGGDSWQEYQLPDGVEGVYALACI